MHKWLSHIFRLFYKTLLLFWEEEGFFKAAALSFYVLVSLVPLLMIVVSIIAKALGESGEVMHQLFLLIKEVIPQIGNNFFLYLEKIIDRNVAGGYIGILVLFFLASVLYANLERVLNQIFKTNGRRNFFHSKLVSVPFLVLMSFVLFIPSALNYFNQLLKSLHLPGLLDYFSSSAWFFTLSSFFAFFFTLLWVPKQRVSSQCALLGALVFSCLLWVAKTLFHAYILFSFKRLNFLYGSLTALILLMSWIYYLSAVFIFCSSFVGVLQEERYKI